MARASHCLSTYKALAHTPSGSPALLDTLTPHCAVLQAHSPLTTSILQSRLSSDDGRWEWSQVHSWLSQRAITGTQVASLPLAFFSCLPRYHVCPTISKNGDHNTPATADVSASPGWPKFAWDKTSVLQIAPPRTAMFLS